ncbi:ZIP-like iron-zinc transporter [Mycena amicta]|nr:ZIP-like iron-zinc transporter [Mycena amicta]
MPAEVLLSIPTQSPDRHLSLRIAALFVILVGSTTSALLPIFLARHYQNRRPQARAYRLQALLDFTKHFGSGVILGTAFIHLLAPGIEALGSSSLPAEWQRFPYALALCLASILSIFLVEIASTRYGLVHRKPSSAKDETLPAGPNAIEPLQSEECSATEGDYHIGTRIIALAILEFGAILHSVLIGLTLAVAPKFKVLCVVLVTHQVFEGLGIGSRLASVSLPSRYSYLRFLGAVLFGLSTPLGLAAGLAATVFSPAFTVDGLHNAEILIVSGVLDSLSAGILMYTALVELIGREILHNEALMRGSGWKLGVALLWVFLGCVLMALLGKWV